MRLYDCGVCSHYHEWTWNGDCRENGARFDSPEEYAQARGISVYDVEVMDMADRVAADHPVTG